MEELATGQILDRPTPEVGGQPEMTFRHRRRQKRQVPVTHEFPDRHFRSSESGALADDDQRPLGLRQQLDGLGNVYR
jgi:hypothetical protein